MLIGRLAGYSLPVLVSAAVRITSIPIVTMYVGPEEIGRFAVLLATSAIFTVASSSIGSYILSHRYHADAVDKRSILLTSVVVEAVIAAIGAVIFISLWPLIGPSGTTFPAVLLAALSIPAGAPWLTILTAVYIDGRTVRFAICQSLIPVVQLAASIVGLMAGLGVTALVIGYFAAQIATLPFALTLLSPARLRKDVLSDVRGLFGVALAANIMEAVMGWAERFSLVHIVGADAAGLYAHSQSYRGLLNSATGAATRAIYPQSMNEARGTEKDFASTAALWRLLFAIFMAAGVAAVFFGGWLVSELTHGKFTGAAPLLPWLCVVLILQQSARPQHFALMAHGRGTVLSFAKLVSTLLGAALVFMLAPLLGLFAPIGALIAKECLHRGILYFEAWRLWRVRFYDFSAVACAAIIVSAIIFKAFG